VKFKHIVKIFKAVDAHTLEKRGKCIYNTSICKNHAKTVNKKTSLTIDEIAMIE